MNVAMTRAKKKLIVIGDSATIGVDDFYNAFLEYVEQYGDYKTCLLYTSPSPRDRTRSRMPSSA